MKHHIPLLSLLSLATIVCAEFAYPPLPKLDAMPSPEDTSGFTPFGTRTPATGLSKRQNCATANSYKCANDNSCCPNGYSCETDGVKSWCCPAGQVCTGEILACSAGNTDCRFVNGGDGCCPTATTYCYQSSSGVFGCMGVGSGSGSGSSGSGAPTCRQSDYYVCADLSGCCKEGTTCVSGQDYCQRPCDTGYTECVGGCCPPGYQCDAAREECRKTTGGGSRLAETTTIGSSSRVRKTSSTTPSTEDATPTPTAGSTLAEETPSSTEGPSSSSSSSSSSTQSVRSTSTQGQPLVTAVGLGGGVGVKVPGVLGVMAVGMVMGVGL